MAHDTGITPVVFHPKLGQRFVKNRLKRVQLAKVRSEAGQRNVVLKYMTL